ncbi:MAG TPA: hypothetical protein VH158_09560 [Gemmatimonadales bacterium]|nr:hypothetical protein [Gemmatimonadales bacterium]
MLGLTLLLASSPPAPAQMRYSVAGGVNVARQVPVVPYGLHGTTSRGFVLQVSVGHQRNRRFGWRLEGSITQFDLTQPTDFAGVLCVFNPPPGTCCGICPLGTSEDLVGVTSVAASEVVSLIQAGATSRLYLTAGPEMAYWYRHPSAQGALRLGGSAGAGVALPMWRHVLAFVEARYHRLFYSPAQPTWLVPLTFGVRF